MGHPRHPKHFCSAALQSLSPSVTQEHERACVPFGYTFICENLALSSFFVIIFLYILAFEERRAARVDESYARERAHTVCLRKHVACPRDLPSDTQKDAPRRCSVLTVAKLLSASCSLRIGSEQSEQTPSRLWLSRLPPFTQSLTAAETPVKQSKSHEKVVTDRRNERTRAADTKGNKLSRPTYGSASMDFSLAT